MLTGPAGTLTRTVVACRASDAAAAWMVSASEQIGLAKLHVRAPAVFDASNALGEVRTALHAAATSFTRT
jgi:hypothetical protein